MEYTSDDIQKAISKKGWSNKQKTDPRESIRLSRS